LEQLAFRYQPEKSLVKLHARIPGKGIGHTHQVWDKKIKYIAEKKQYPVIYEIISFNNIVHQT
jgi:hypothetical protein